MNSFETPYNVFSEDEISLLLKLGINRLKDNDDDFINIEEKVADHLVLKCFDENYEPNQEGLICESILDKLNEL